MKIKNEIRYGMFCLLAVLMFASLTAAFGIGSSYWKGQPFIISPGETRTATLYMQNLIGDEAVTVMVELKEGSGVASVDEREYTVPFGVDDMPFPVSISIPENAEVGTVYPVVISFVEVGEPGSGTISVGRGYDISFDVEVVAGSTQPEPVKTGGNAAVWISLAVLVILIIVIVILVRKKK